MFVFCHDQEPLDLDFFPKVAATPLPNLPLNPFRLLCPNILNKYDRVVVVHSELNSEQVQWFENNGAVPVYWWSHAVIALDWFRYAKVDPVLRYAQPPVKDFLIYNRAWQGSREYRLKFSELLVEHNLHNHCQMGFNPIDGQHYVLHQFRNPTMQIKRWDLEQYFEPNRASSVASADYCAADYVNTGIEVVLETLFDDTKWHLTEKVLRPIACGQPFILASTPGSLQYLRRYGFKTFNSLIDESYDTIQDPVERLQAVVTNMNKIARLPAGQKRDLYASLKPIADYNRQRFFSADFFQQVVDEFKTNFDQAASVMQANMTGALFRFYLRLAERPNVRPPASQDEITAMLQILDQRV